jgi:hypothetical protein
MKRIVFGHQLKHLRGLLQSNAPEILHVVRVDYDQSSKAVWEWLSLPGHPWRIQEVEESEYVTDYEQLYADFMGELNGRNQCLEWWALDLTNKNPITTQLPKCIYYAILIECLIRDPVVDYLLVVCDNQDIADQVAYSHRRQTSVEVINAIHCLDVTAQAKKWFPIAAVYRFLTAVGAKIWLRFYPPSSAPLPSNPCQVVVSLLYRPCFKGERFEDVYFGQLPQHLRQKGVQVIHFMEVCAPYREMVRKTRLYAANSWIFPKEFFLSWRRLLRAFGTALRHFFGRREFDTQVPIGDCDVGFLVNRFIRHEYTSARFFSNMLIYHAACDLCQLCRVERLYYPFENRSFEKMIVLALRKKNAEAKLVGHQHSTLSLQHANFLLGAGEHCFTPLPDLIVTTGEVTRRFMQERGRFPKAILRVGCALRQVPFVGHEKPRPHRVANVFVALATNLEEYVKVLSFLDRAQVNWEDCQLWIRPHPMFSLEEAIRIAGQPQFKFHKADEESLEECYTWADVVLYVHSTLAIESLRRGIPVVNLAVRNRLNPDTLHGFDDFRWVVRSPEYLFDTLMKIQGLSDQEYQQRRKRGVDFALEYLIEVSALRMEEFCSD